MRISKPPEERKAELLAAARTLFDKNGVSKTRVSDIVQSVGVSQGIFYYYFNSKQEIVHAVVEQVVAELRQQLDEIFSSQNSFYQKIAGFISLYINVIDQFTGDDEPNIPPRDDELIYERLMLDEGQGLLQKAMKRLVQQGVQENMITIEYPYETVLVIMYGLRSYAMQRLPSRRMVFTIVEQSLQLPPGTLVRYSGKGPKKRA